MTLPKDKNHMYTDFIDAYWAVSTLGYDSENVVFALTCYVSREARMLDGTSVEEPSIEGFGSCLPIYRPELYYWHHHCPIADIFPEGIPLDKDEQLKAVYLYIKAYTGLPFEDVFEGDQKPEEPTEEPIEETIPEETPTEEEPIVDEPTEETPQETEEELTEESDQTEEETTTEEEENND